MRSKFLIFTVPIMFIASTSVKAKIHMPWQSAYEAKKFDHTGHKALIITTSYASLDTISDDGEILEKGDPTGVYAAEMTEPYYQFLDAGMEVTIASLKGGPIPVDPKSLKFLIRTSYDSRYLKDREFQNKVSHSFAVTDLDFATFDIIYMAGGWGAAYDLGRSKDLGEKLSVAFAADKILAAVCHGPLGFLNAKKPDGSPLVKGLRMTAVTNKQVRELKIEQTPLHPETELRNRGALYESKSAIRDFFANHVVICGKIVTGQNQRAGVEVAQRAMELLFIDNEL